MWNDLSQVYQSELDKDERILWSAQPRAGLMLQTSDVFTIPFSLMWGGFAIFWEWQVVSGERLSLFALWGVPFVLIGMYMVVGRFFVDSIRRSKTYYALTDRRIIIIGSFVTWSIKSIDMGTLREITLSNLNSSGQGTIVLGPVGTFDWMYSDYGFGRSNRQLAPRLEMIEDARNVYDQIRTAQKEAQNSIRRS